MLQRLEKTLFFIFVFLIPFQFRIFLHNGGDEWGSVFLYLGDIIFVAVLILWILRIHRINRTDQTDPPAGEAGRTDRTYWFLAAFAVIAGLSILVSSDSGISIYRFIKLLEFVALFAYVYQSYRSDRSDRSYQIFWVVFASGIFQAILAIAQFLKQGSLGLKYIEAGILSPNSTGVANFVLDGIKIMRSYGSFLHPNILSAFLLFAIFAFYVLWLTGRIGPIRLIGPIGLIGFVLLIFALFLTFSRAAILVFLIASLLLFLIGFFKTRYQSTNDARMARMKIIKLFGLFLVSCILVIIVLYPYVKARFFTISMEEQAVDLRFFYDKIALSMIKERPLLGIGVGNFVHYSQNYQTFLRAALKYLGSGSQAAIPQWIYQPVHNIYLLIASETGILGLIMFLLFLGKTLMGQIRPIRPIGWLGPMTALVVGFLIIGLADHYFWTLQSGALMFWLALGLTRSDQLDLSVL